MIVKRIIFRKLLSTAAVAEFLIVRKEGDYEATLFLNGKYVPGPSLPKVLDPPKGDVTHWMGNKPSVRLTLNEAEKINAEVALEKSVLRHQEQKKAFKPPADRPWRFW